MSFGEQFRQQALPVFRHVYLRVSELEQISNSQLGEPRSSRSDSASCPTLRFILNRTQQQHPISDAEASLPEDTVFALALTRELDRLIRFVESYSEELWVRVGSTLETLDNCTQAAKSPKKRATVREEGLASLDCDCGELCESLILMDEFQRQNILAAAFLAQNHDVQLQEKKNKKQLYSAQHISPVYLKAVEQYLIVEGALDPLVLGLSEAYSKIRKLRSRVLGEDSVWEPPDVFQRNTTKYWIHPADVLRVKCLVMKHLPILIFGKQSTQTSIACKLTPLKEHTQREHGLVASVYFDTTKLDTYHERMVREHGASLVRIRWYGKETAGIDDKVFVERKVHKDGWTGEKSYKERADLPAKEVKQFLSGSTVPTMSEDNPKAPLLKELQDRIHARNEVPSVRTEYRRIAFQESSSNRVRMSLDTNLRILKELNAPKNTQDWCRCLSFELEDSDVVHFPYAVFEIKIQGDDPPDWVQDLIQGGMLVEIPKFSKFLHGTAMLFGSKLRNSPGWFAPDEEGYMTPASLHEMADNADFYSKGAADFLFPRTVSTRENPNSKSLDRHPMQVSTLCHVPDHHTVLSEVVVMPSRQQNHNSSRRVVHTSLHGHSSRIPSGRQRSLSNGGIGHSLDLSSRNAGKPCKWKAPWRKQDPSYTSPNGNRAAALVRTRIEPKTFFANERTFLSWLTVAVMVMFMGLSLLDASGTARSGLGLFGSGARCQDSSSAPIHITTDYSNGTTEIYEKGNYDGGLGCDAAKISGALIAPMALILMVYALYMYRKRSIQILRRETVRYDDQYGPVILTLLLVTVLLLAYVVSVA